MGKKWVKNEITGLQKTALMHALAHLGRVETAVGGVGRVETAVGGVGRPASSSFASEKDLTAQLGRGTPLAEQASRALLQPPRPLHIPRLAPARYLSVANRSAPIFARFFAVFSLFKKSARIPESGTKGQGGSSVTVQNGRQKSGRRRSLEE